MAKVGSSGIAKAGLATGITGTALGGIAVLKEAYDTVTKNRNANANSGGAATGATAVPGGVIGIPLTGGNTPSQTGGHMGFGTYLGLTDNALAMQGAALGTISDLQAKLAQANAERYTDQIGAAVFDRALQLSNRNDEKINANLKEAFQELVVTRERLARNDVLNECTRKDLDRMSSGLASVQAEVADMRVREQRTADAIDCLAKSTSMRFDSVYKDIDCAKRECGDAIALEAERRHAADQSIRCYVDATFVPGRLVMPKDAICPEVMQRWNSWTAPTGEAPATQPISGSVNATVTSRGK